VKQQPSLPAWPIYTVNLLVSCALLVAYLASAVWSPGRLILTVKYVTVTVGFTCSAGRSRSERSRMTILPCPLCYLFKLSTHSHLHIVNVHKKTNTYVIGYWSWRSTLVVISCVVTVPAQCCNACRASSCFAWPHQYITVRKWVNRSKLTARNHL
jgi:hypothetical protein